MNKQYSKLGEPQDEWQTLEDHLGKVADKAAEFAGAFL